MTRQEMPFSSLLAEVPTHFLSWHTRPHCRAAYYFAHKIIPMHMMIRETIPGRQQRVQRCPL